MVILNGTSIIRMEKRGIAYLDSDGLECFIDFKACNERNANERWRDYKASIQYDSRRTKLSFLSPIVELFSGFLRLISAEFAQNFRVKWLSILEARAKQKYIGDAKKYKNVANRNINGHPHNPQDKPYIEFYTDPIIRFNLADSEEFYKVCNHIRASAWRTFDVT